MRDTQLPLSYLPETNKRKSRNETKAQQGLFLVDTNTSDRENGYQQIYEKPEIPAKKRTFSR